MIGWEWVEEGSRDGDECINWRKEGREEGWKAKGMEEGR